MNDMAKIFWSGRSQAVRLPKEYRFEGEQVSIHREGNKVILQAAPDVVGDAAADEIDRLRALIDDGYASGPSEPFDAAEIKRQGRLSQR
jgi:virulence-associated protein VagC